MPNSLSTLPLSPSELQSGVENAVAALMERGLSEEESKLKLGYDWDFWLDDSSSSYRFPVDLGPILERAGWSPPGGQGRATCYASLISKITGRFTRTRRDSAIVLSQLPLILQLAQKFRDGINRLFQPNAGTPFIPYLQILLYICTVDHFFDHPPEFIYTFKPSGEVANLIFGVFPPELAPGGNPMLNNFKAVNRITMDWAESRPDNREQARALVEIVEGLSSLAYSPRVQIPSMIRNAIIRFIEINTPTRIVIEAQTDIEACKRFVQGVAANQSGTRGVIEQRVVDFLAAIDHPDTDWRSRGLGDPVNASNASSKKLGDCDFQNIPARQCVALEAHAGRLTDVYVREHLRTLRLNLPSRLEEWSRISELSEWRLSLRFLVHEDASSRERFSLPVGITGSLEVLTYMDYYDTVLPQIERDPERALALFNRWVVTTLDANNTPVTTKEIARRLFNA